LKCFTKKDAVLVKTLVEKMSEAIPLHHCQQNRRIISTRGEMMKHSYRNIV